MNRDLGIVRPLYGRWTWPFGMMEEGDWFLVDQMDRETERVRNLASVRAAQLGKRFKVEKHPVEHPGFTKVECVPDDYEAAEHRQPALEFSVARERLRDLYGFNLDDLHWGHIHDGKPVEVKMQALDDLPKRRIVVKLWPASLYDLGVELFEDHLRFVSVPKGWKPHVWEAKYDWWEAEGRNALVEAEQKDREERQAQIDALKTERERRPLFPPPSPSLDDVMD